MCFEVPTLDGDKSGYNDDANDDDLGIADIDENDSKSSTCTSLSKYPFYTLNFLFKNCNVIFICSVI